MKNAKIELPHRCCFCGPCFAVIKFVQITILKVLQWNFWVRTQTCMVANMVANLRLWLWCATNKMCAVFEYHQYQDSDVEMFPKTEECATASNNWNELKAIDDGVNDDDCVAYACVRVFLRVDCHSHDCRHYTVAMTIQSSKSVRSHHNSDSNGSQRSAQESWLFRIDAVHCTLGNGNEGNSVATIGTTHTHTHTLKE